MKIHAIILVEPIGKGRARVAVVAGHAHAYTPKKTRDSEAQISWAIKQAVKGNVFPPGIPLKLTAFFYRSRPKSAPKRVTKPFTKPDLDNHAKLLLDALNKFAFADDAQVTSMNLRKRFAAPGTSPRIEIDIEEDTDA